MDTYNIASISKYGESYFRRQHHQRLTYKAGHTKKYQKIIMDQENLFYLRNEHATTRMIMRINLLVFHIIIALLYYQSQIFPEFYLYHLLDYRIHLVI